MAHAPQFIETIVISTRIRLARNFAAYPFPRKMDEAQAGDIVYLVEKACRSLIALQDTILQSLTSCMRGICRSNT